MLSRSKLSSSPRHERVPRGRLTALLIAALVAIGGLVAVPAPAMAAPPTNDNFANAQVLTGSPATASGSNVDATAEVNEPDHYYIGGASVWYSWTAQQDGVVVADPAGSSFDTTMSIYTGSSVDQLTRIASVDDSDGTRQGLVEFPVTTGMTYMIAVDGYDGESGSVEFRLTFASSDSGAISGHVVDSQYQVDRYGVCVDAYAAEGESAGQATSDGYGQYRIAGLEPGDYRVGFSDCASGTLLEFYDDAPTYELATPVTVVASIPTTDIDAEVVVPGPGFVSGQVTDTVGNPLADICVNINLVDSNTSWQTRTDSDGRYRVEVESGRLQAYFMSCSLGYPIEEWYDGTIQENADTFTVAAGQETTGIDASMVIGGQVTGTVKDDDGAALPLVCVDLLDESGEWVQDPIVTGTNGTFRFRNVVPGTYFVKYRNCRDIGPFGDEFFEDAATLAEATPVVVPAAGTAVADGVLERIADPDTVILTGPAEGSTIASSTATFTFASDPAEAARSFMCQIDFQNWSACTNPRTFTNLSQGSHTFRVYAVGEVGVEDPTEAERTFRVDTAAPNTTIDSGPTGVITADEATFTFHGAQNDTAKIQCRVDDAAWADCTSPTTFEDLSEGEHTVTFRAEDAVGNQDQTPASRSFTVDTVAPDTTIDSGPDGAIATDAATFTVHGTAADTAKIQCRIDDAAWADCTSPATFDQLDEGDHTVAFRAEDAAGNQDQTPATRDFTVDLEAPDTTIDSGPDGAIATDAATFTFHGTAADTAKIQCRIDDDAWAGCTSPTTFDDLSDGEHSVSFRAEDAAGNQDQTPAIQSFSVDTIAPDTTIDSGPDAGATLTSRSASFTFHGTAGDTQGLQCRVDGSAWADCTSPTNLVDLADGSHGVEFRAVDAAGNADASPASRTFVVQVPVVGTPQPQPKATTRLVLSAPSKVRQGTKVKVSLRLSGVTNGTVVIRDGKKIVKTIRVKGKATVKLRLKKLGKHRLSASYAGTTVAKPAKSAVRTVVVKRKR